MSEHSAPNLLSIWGQSGRSSLDPIWTQSPPSARNLLYQWGQSLLCFHGTSQGTFDEHAINITNEQNQLLAATERSVASFDHPRPSEFTEAAVGQSCGKEAAGQDARRPEATLGVKHQQR